MLRSLFAVGLISVAMPAHGQMLMDTSSVAGQNRTKVSASFASSEVEYEGTRSVFEVERKTLGAELGMGISQDVDLVAQLGVIMDTEVEGLRDDGHGFNFGAGLRAVLYRSGATRITSSALFSYQTEEIEWSQGGADAKYEMDTYELHLGSTVSHAVSPTVAPYIGLDLIAFDDGEAKIAARNAVASESIKADIERDDIVNLKIGANINVAKATVRPEVTLMGETTFALAASTTF